MFSEQGQSVYLFQTLYRESKTDGPIVEALGVSESFTMTFPGLARKPEDEK